MFFPLGTPDTQAIRYSGKKARANLERRGLEWGRKTKSLTRERRENYAVFTVFAGKSVFPVRKKELFCRLLQVTRAYCGADLRMEENKGALNRDEYKKQWKRGRNRGPKFQRGLACERISGSRFSPSEKPKQPDALALLRKGACSPPFLLKSVQFSASAIANHGVMLHRDFKIRRLRTTDYEPRLDECCPLFVALGWVVQIWNVKIALQTVDYERRGREGNNT